MLPPLLLLLLLLASVQGEEESPDVITVEARHGEVFSIQLNASLLSGATDVRELALCSVMAEGKNPDHLCS